jgi:hypothetical protein
MMNEEEEKKTRFHALSVVQGPFLHIICILASSNAPSYKMLKFESASSPSDEESSRNRWVIESNFQKLHK